MRKSTLARAVCRKARMSAIVSVPVAVATSQRLVVSFAIVIGTGIHYSEAYDGVNVSGS